MKTQKDTKLWVAFQSESIKNSVGNNVSAAKLTAETGKYAKIFYDRLHRISRRFPKVHQGKILSFLGECFAREEIVL